MKAYTIWLEGYQATGEHGTATCLGSHQGETFQDACKQAVIARDMDLKSYSEERNTYWGCRFFDNEAEAREGFG